ncbi:MAG: DUF4214 domain-containing protein [Acidimicrobiales bacterium]|nr:DUF4214 domain-containing protein [Acidimicrobiales bacterium]
MFTRVGAVRPWIESLAGGLAQPTPPPAPAPAPAPAPQPTPTPASPSAACPAPGAGPLARLYRAYFLRQPDADGLAYWFATLQQGTPLGAVSELFAQSAEFQSTYGQLSSGDFVKLVYRNVLGREPDPGGYAHWAPWSSRARSPAAR